MSDKPRNDGAMHPVLVEIGGFPIYSYGFLLLLAFVGAIVTLIWLGGRQGHSRDEMVEMALWAILIGIAGSRLGYVLQNMSYYAQHPLEILNLRQGGMTLITGLILGAVALAVYFRRKGVPFMNVLDLVSAPGLVGMAIGRIGCVLHGCCYGKLCDGPLALTYPEGALGAGVPGGPRHPVQLYEMGLDLLLLAFIIWYLPRVKFAGQAFWATFGMYGLIRFSTEFLREGSLIGPLSLAQWTSLAFAILSLLGWVGLFGRQPVVTNWRFGEDGSKARSSGSGSRKKSR